MSTLEIYSELVYNEANCAIKEHNMFKKCLSIVLVILLILLCACSAEKPTEKQTQPTTTTVPTVSVTIEPGFTVDECAKLLEEKGVCEASQFMSAADKIYSDRRFIKDIPNPEERPFVCEGYIFADTYEFNYCMDAQSVLDIIFNNLESKITDAHISRAAELGYTIDEILTMASIIQEESTPREMKNVSSVIHNRLNSPYGKLECDVTIFYLNNHVKPHVSDITQYRELYNTYNFKGLPAGPITNVSIDAIEAALYPADTDYYFFVYDEEKNYYYAVTWEEHSDNVSKYYKK